MVDGAAGGDQVDAKLTRFEDEDEGREQARKERGLGVRGGVTGVTRAVNIGRNEVSTRNKGRNGT